MSFEHLDSSFQTLCEQHPGWAATLADCPVWYSLPRAVVDDRDFDRFFADRFPKAERAFTAYCEQRWIVAVEGKRFVQFQPLTFRPIVVSRDKATRLGWSAGQLAGAKVVQELHRERNDRLLGVAGWLMTNPRFLEEREVLRRTVAPVCGTSTPQLADLDLRESPTKAAVAAREGVRAFLRRWCLTALATWDLPLPQGPLVPNPLAADAASNPQTGVHVFIPVHYPLQSGEELVRDVRRSQELVARSLDLPIEAAGVTHADMFAQIFRWLLVERAVEQRLGAGRRPKGIITWLHAAAAKHLDVEAATIRRYTMWVKQCRAGGREGIGKLRDRRQ